jgi:hypothetical protein
MEDSDPTAEGGGSEEDQIRAVVPTRAVLTELARGFLLVQESNPQQALRFAETFLKEHTAESIPTRVDVVGRVTRGRLALGRFPRGAVEPAASGKPPGSG